MRDENANARTLAWLLPALFGAFLLGHQVGAHSMREEMWRMNDRCRALLRTACPGEGEKVQPPSRFDLGDNAGDHVWDLGVPAGDATP